jgi:hypothetical protein
MTLVRAQVVDDLPPANLAQPAEQCGLAAKARKAAHCLGQRRLHDFLRRFDFAAQPRQSEAVHPRKIRREEAAEGSLVARQHGGDQLTVGRVHVST